MSARLRHRFALQLLVVIGFSFASLKAFAEAFTANVSSNLSVGMNLDSDWNGDVWMQDKNGQNRVPLFSGQVVAMQEPGAHLPDIVQPWQTFLKRAGNSEKFYFVTREPTDSSAQSFQFKFHVILPSGSEAGKHFVFTHWTVPASEAPKFQPVVFSRRLSWNSETYLLISYGGTESGQKFGATEIFRESDGVRLGLEIPMQEWDVESVSVAKDGAIRNNSGKLIAKLEKNTSVVKPASVAQPEAAKEKPAARVFSIKDPSVRAEIKTLKPRLKSHVYGQDKAVDLAADAIQNKAVTPDNKPVVLVALGPTGTGKTELAKGIAIERFKSIDALAQFDMGSVKSIANLNAIFGSPSGYINSDKIGPFETYLKAHPEGVILFDEIGNMGDGDDPKSDKDTLLKPFYMMLDEGQWRSPSTGVLYSLANYVIIYSSNEGQEITSELPYDDLRLDAWERANNREDLTALLKSHGWPQAFIGRLGGNITLFKPLLEAERAFIARKTLEKQIRLVKSEHGIQNVSYDETTLKTLGNALFLINEGGRSIVSGVEHSFRTLITGSLIDLYDTDAKIEDVKFSIEARDLRARKDLPAGEARIPITLKMQAPGQAEISTTIDLNDRAAILRKQTKFERLVVSIHEAGHAIANDPNLTGRTLKQVTNQGAGHMGGYALYDDIALRYPGTRWENAVAMIASKLGGGLAEQMYMPAGGPSSGWTMDLHQARKEAQHLIAVNNISPRSLEFESADGEVIVSSTLVQQEIRRLMKEAETMARERLKQNWPALRALTAKLMKHKTLSGAQYRSIHEDVREGRTRAKPYMNSCSAIFAK